MISYGGDCIGLSVVKNTMGVANPNCRLAEYNISAIRIALCQLSYSVIHGLQKT